MQPPHRPLPLPRARMREHTASTTQRVGRKEGAKWRGGGQQGPDPHVVPDEGSPRGQLRADMRHPRGGAGAALCREACRKAAAGTAGDKTLTTSGRGGFHAEAGGRPHHAVPARRRRAWHGRSPLLLGGSVGSSGARVSAHTKIMGGEGRGTGAELRVCLDLQLCFPGRTDQRGTASKKYVCPALHPGAGHVGEFRW